MAHSGIKIFFEGQNFQRLLQGMLVAGKIAVISLVIGILLGVVLGVIRTSPSRIIRFVFRIYMEIFRIVPLLVLLFVFYYLLPDKLGLNLNNEVVSILVFVLWISAEMSDIVRSALISVPIHQVDAGRSLGLSKIQLYQYVLIPQGIPMALPATINLTTRVIKTTSLLLMIGVPEMIKVGQQVIENYTITVPTASLWIYGFIFCLYFVMCYPLSKLATHLEKSRRIREGGEGN